MQRGTSWGVGVTLEDGLSASVNGTFPGKVGIWSSAPEARAALETAVPLILQIRKRRLPEGSASPQSTVSSGEPAPSREPGAANPGGYQPPQESRQACGCWETKATPLPPSLIMASSSRGRCELAAPADPGNRGLPGQPRQGAAAERYRHQGPSRRDAGLGRTPGLHLNNGFSLSLPLPAVKILQSRMLV